MMGASIRQAAWCGLAALGLAACQTVPKPINPRLPAVLEDVFDTCGGGDGELTLRAKATGTQYFSSSVEWLAKSPVQWDMEAFNQMGVTLLKVKYAGDRNAFTVGGQLASRLPPLEADSDRYLRLDGHFLPLRASEIPCLLKIKFPRAWRDRVTAMREVPGGIELKVWDEERDMLLTARNMANLQSAQVCVNLGWTRMLGLVRREITICENLGTPLTARLRGLEGVDIEWTRADGP